MSDHDREWFDKEDTDMKVGDNIKKGLGMAAVLLIVMVAITAVIVKNCGGA